MASSSLSPPSPPIVVSDSVLNTQSSSPSAPVSSSLVEMSQLPSIGANASPAQERSRSPSPSRTSVLEEETHNAQQQSSQVPTSGIAPSSAPPDPSAPQDIEALGPAAEDVPLPAADTAVDVSVLSVTLMLTTGARHPYRIDEKYLRSRKVDAINEQGLFDPREMSAYQLKELIWTDWRSEWEPRPASPSSIRLICLGRMLEDKSPLKDFRLKLNDINVLHMTVKPADFLDDDETIATAGKGHHAIRTRDGGEGGAGCRCVIL